MGLPAPPEFYDIDHAHKSSLARRVTRSPNRYSCMRSTAPRFQRDEKDGSPFGVYDVDSTMNKKSIETGTRDSRRFYSASFDSQTPRFMTSKTGHGATDAMYLVDKVMNSHSATTEKTLKSSPNKYAILRSKYKRFNNRATGEGPDAVYDADSGPKTSLQKAIATSPIKYGNVLKGTGRDHSIKREAPHLGPGTYDYRIGANSLVVKEAQPLSSMMSRSSRFLKQKGGAGVGLGSTWTQEKDTKNGWKNGTQISKTDYLRPAYMPNSYKEKQ